MERLQREPGDLKSTQVFIFIFNGRRWSCCRGHSDETWTPYNEIIVVSNDDAPNVKIHSCTCAKSDTKKKKTYLIQPLHFFHIWKVDLWTSNMGEAWTQTRHGSVKWPPALSRAVKILEMIVLGIFWACGLNRNRLQGSISTWLNNPPPKLSTPLEVEREQPNNLTKDSGNHQPRAHQPFIQTRHMRSPD